MSLSILARTALVCCCSLAMLRPGVALGQGNYAGTGTEYPIAGTLPGDQVRPQLSLSANGGFLVWEDNMTDGAGLGISAVRLDSSLSPMFAPFRVNANGTDDQERPQVTLLKNGGTAFVWQGGRLGFQHIYARFQSSGNVWITDDIAVNTAANRAQVDPAVSALANTNVVVVYGSFNQVNTNSLQDVYGQILNPGGQKIGGEFLVNTFTPFNQRAASVAGLTGGGFVVVWVSEQQRSGSMDASSPDFLYSPTNKASVDIFGRLFASNGTATSGEFLINTAYEISGSPRVAASPDGGFTVVWAQRTAASPAQGWDIVARPFSSTGQGAEAVTVNSYLYGDQFSPQITALGSDFFIVWTSLAQDGSREGTYGRFIRSTGMLAGSEVRVNSTTVGQQFHACVGSDGAGRFLSVWSGFVGGMASFDLVGQRWVNVAQPLLAMAAPFVHVPFVVTDQVYQPQLQVSWPLMSGLQVDHYEVYVNGLPTPRASLTTNLWLMTSAEGLTVNSTNYFQVAYVAADGRRSPLSAAAGARTWSGFNWGGIPGEWMQRYYGSINMMLWPNPSTLLAEGGPSLLQVFQSGASPLDPGTWLRTSIVREQDGYYLHWNPQPGLIYQVQTSLTLSNWANLGAPRFSAGTDDAINIGGNNAAYYRVLRLR